MLVLFRGEREIGLLRRHMVICTKLLLYQKTKVWTHSTEPTYGTDIWNRHTEPTCVEPSQSYSVHPPFDFWFNPRDCRIGWNSNDLLPLTMCLRKIVQRVEKQQQMHQQSTGSTPHACIYTCLWKPPRVRRWLPRADKLPFDRNYNGTARVKGTKLQYIEKDVVCPKTAEVWKKLRDPSVYCSFLFLHSERFFKIFIRYLIILHLEKRKNSIIKIAPPCFVLTEWMVTNSNNTLLSPSLHAKSSTTCTYYVYVEHPNSRVWTENNGGF